MASLLEPTAVAFNVYNKINLRSKKYINYGRWIYISSSFENFKFKQKI